MSTRWTNGLLGFSFGSLAYFAFLGVAYFTGIFRPEDYYLEAVDRVALPFWGEIVLGADLDSSVQAHVVYGAAAVGAALLALIDRPVRTPLPIGSPARTAVAYGFGSAVVMNFWFAVSNLAPQLTPW